MSRVRFNNFRCCNKSSKIFLLLIQQVKWLHTNYVKDVPPYCGAVPEYPAWFEPFVMQWLNENDDVSLEYLNGAFNRDKRDGVRIKVHTLNINLCFSVQFFMVNFNFKSKVHTKKVLERLLLNTVWRRVLTLTVLCLNGKMCYFVCNIGALNVLSKSVLFIDVGKI